MDYKKEALLAAGTGGLSAGMAMLTTDGNLIRGIILVVLGVALLAFRGYCKKYGYKNGTGRSKVQGQGRESEIG